MICFIAFFLCIAFQILKEENGLRFLLHSAEKIGFVENKQTTSIPLQDRQAFEGTVSDTL